MRPLGEITGSLHLALAEAFGVRTLAAGETPTAVGESGFTATTTSVVFSRTDTGWVARVSATTR